MLRPSLKAFAELASKHMRRGAGANEVMGDMMGALAALAVHERMSGDEFVRHASQFFADAKRVADVERGVS